MIRNNNGHGGGRLAYKLEPTPEGERRTVEILTIIILLAGVVVLIKTVRMVPQGYEWTVERFGKYTHTMSPGLHFLMPVIQGVGRKVNMMEQVLDVPLYWHHWRNGGELLAELTQQLQRCAGQWLVPPG
mgnify:CR=1 FL=1